MFTKTGLSKKFSNSTKSKKSFLPKLDLDKEQEQEARKMQEQETNLMRQAGLSAFNASEAAKALSQIMKPIKQETKLITELHNSGIVELKEPSVSESIRRASLEIMNLFSKHENINFSIQRSANSLTIQIN